MADAPPPPDIPAQAPPLDLNGYAGWARVVSMYDGDTCTVVVPVPGLGHRRVRVRLLGIDTPEMRGGGPGEKERAVSARDRFAQLVGFEPTTAPTFAWLQCSSNDKYGRTLATVFPRPGAPASVNETLLAEGLARAYVL